jgi:hypothetical protein
MDTDELAKNLLSICSSKELRISVISEEVMRLVLLVGSETPDNLNCYSHIEYGIVPNEKDNADPQDKATYGLKIRGKDISIADIMNVIEDIDIPAEVATAFPTITEHEWNAVTRIITMILLSVECTR